MLALEAPDLHLPGDASIGILRRWVREHDANIIEMIQH
jgi:hypothetical protein